MHTSLKLWELRRNNLKPLKRKENSDINYYDCDKLWLFPFGIFKIMNLSIYGIEDVWV